MTTLKNNLIFIAATAWASRLINSAVQLFGIRYLLGSLGSEGYSSFVLLAALASWCTLADLGIGYSLQNYISESRAKNQKTSLWITSAALTCAPILIILAIIIYYFSPSLSISYLESANFLSNYEKNLAFGLTTLLFVLTSLGSVAYRVWYAKQMGWLANIVPAFAAVFGLFNIVFFNISTFSVPVLAAVILYFGPHGILSVGALIFIWHKNKEKTSLKNNLFIILLLIKKGWGFWIFAILSTLVLQADYIVMSQKLSSNNIVLYSILQKIFGLAFFMYSSLLQALWPICSELNTLKHWDKIRKISSRYIWVGIIWIIIFSIGFQLFSKNILSLLKYSGEINNLTIILFGIYFAIRVWTDTYAVLLQSMNITRPLWYFVATQALIGFCLQWLWAESSGIDGLLMGLISSFMLTVTIGLPIIFYSKIKTISQFL